MQEAIQRLSQLLAEQRVKHAFGITGSGASLSLISELEARQVRYHGVSHEAAAAIMAGTVCRLTEELSVSISIKGPGLANMIPGIAHNHFEATPALSIAEAFGSDVPLSRRHKRLAHDQMLSAVTKATGSLQHLDRQFPWLLDAARREVPGPVHLDMCFKDDDLPSQDASPSCPDVKTSRQGALRDLRQKLRASTRPLLLVGALAARRGWKALLNHLRIPILTTVSAKGVMDELLPHCAGIFTGDGKELAPETRLLADADLLVGIGLRNTEVLSARPLGVPTVLIDEVDLGLAEGFGADVLVADGDADLITEILHELGGKSWGARRIESARQRLSGALLDQEWLPARCFAALGEWRFPYTLVVDTGSFCTIAEHLWQANADRRFVASSNGRYMGIAIPAAVAAAICEPERPVACVTGDGGMRMYPAEIKRAIHDSLPVCFILMSDGRYGSVAQARREPVCPSAVDVIQPSWWKAVEAMGCEAYPVAGADRFTQIIASWKRNAPLFIEATFDQQAYAEMTSRLR